MKAEHNKFKFNLTIRCSSSSLNRIDMHLLFYILGEIQHDALNVKRHCHLQFAFEKLKKLSRAAFRRMSMSMLEFLVTIIMVIILPTTFFWNTEHLCII